jgi:hypothetical protein
MDEWRLVFRTHAIRRMFRRRISDEDVRHVLRTGDVIDEYPEDMPFPSRLVLGFVGTRPLHVVVADDALARKRFVITAYEPDLKRWEPSFRRRRGA